MTPKFKDQIVSRTHGKRWIILAKNLGEEIRESIVKQVKQQHKNEYDRCYEMLTILMKEFGQSDWLFVKQCYKNAGVEEEIIKATKLFIKGDMRGKRTIQKICHMRKRREGDKKDKKSYIGSRVLIERVMSPARIFVFVQFYSSIFSSIVSDRNLKISQGAVTKTNPRVSSYMLRRGTFI